VGAGWDVGVSPPGVARGVSPVGVGAVVGVGDGVKVGVGPAPEQAAKRTAAVIIIPEMAGTMPGAGPGLIFAMNHRLTILLPMMDGPPIWQVLGASHLSTTYLSIELGTVLEQGIGPTAWVSPLYRLRT
jgi:hypothetical protein